MKPQSHIFHWTHRLTLFVLIAVVVSSAFTPENRAIASSFTQLNFYPNIETAGVVVSGVDLPKTAQLLYRQSGEVNWRTGHALMRIDDGRLVGSLFGLSASITYEVKVIDGVNEVTGSLVTQPDELQFAPTTILRVDDDAQLGGDGSALAPFKTIQEAVNRAQPGTQVLVADGVYREAVNFPASGTVGNWIQVKAEGSGAILDGSISLPKEVWEPHESRSHVFFTRPGWGIKYLARDQQRFYQYDSLHALLESMGHNDVPMKEGWFYEPSSGKLYIRIQQDPWDYSWQMPQFNGAFSVDGRDWIWIEGFEMRFYGTGFGCGACLNNASHIVVRKNKIHNLQNGVFVSWTGGEDRGNDTRIEYNEFYDPPLNEWPWNSVKGTAMEATAIVLRGHIGTIVRGNHIHNYFNGIYTSSSAALDNPGVAFDVDVYNNNIHHIADDALEPEGTCINHRFRNNTIDSMLVGISLAPITMGPVWVMRSTFTNFTGRSIKFDRNSDGWVMIYHNTSWTNKANRNSMEMISAVSNVVLRNNIFQGNGLSVEETQTGSTGHDWNNDNWYTTLTTTHFKWENVNYSTIANLCKGVGLECNGHENPPGLANPGGGDLSLLQSSPNVDRGALIPGINDGFAGSAPDIGAFETAFGIPTPVVTVTPTIVFSPPVVSNILRADPSPTAANVVHFNVTFSKEVTGVDVGDFSLTTSGTITGANIAEVAGAGAAYVITVNTGLGDGSLRLDLLDNDSIVDAANNPLGGAGAGNGSFNANEEYAMNRTAPVILNILRFDPDPTVAATVRFAVAFSEAVRGVDAGDFTPIGMDSIAGAVITDVSGADSTYIVTVNTGSGTGSIRLDALDNDSIVDVDGNPLGGAGSGNGNFNTGETYSVSRLPIVQVKVTFTSTGAADGWVLESQEDSSRGGTKNSNEITFTLGDDGKDRQYRGILQFPTASLPDNAVVTMALLMIKSQSYLGTNPFSTHQNILVDIRRGSFGIPLDLLGVNMLQVLAFHASASQSSAGVIANNPVGDWYWSMLAPSAMPYINLNGATQLRLRFQVDDNDDRGNDYIKFYSGNYRSVENHPQLLVEYYVP
ncbi:MAG: right-handed parallel beta-helix repeat-containing protein [Anaerolineales bacterium]|nr:right-handed parallel beta-helix repeat-containing protein [Anaerolineales bacterium]